MNLDKLQTLKITPSEFVYLVFLYLNKECWFTISLENLQTKGFIKIGEDEIFLRAKTTNLMKEFGVSSPDEVEILVDQYRAYFPSGVKTSGYPIKGDKQACITKMKEFKTKYDYSNEEILEAARVYTSLQKKNLWKGTQLAHYYISKDGISNLANMCEDLRENGHKEQNSTGTVEVV